MTDNDWIKQLQSTMEHHEEAAPDGLWSDIESRLPQPRKATPSWLRYAAAAVVAGTIIGTGSLLWNAQRPSGVTSSDQPTLAQVEDNPIVEESSTNVKKTIQAKASPYPSQNATVLAKHRAVTRPSTPSQTAHAQETTEEEVVQTTSNDNKDTVQPGNPPTPTITTMEEPLYATVTPNNTMNVPTRQTRKHVSIAFFATNPLSELLGSGKNGDYMVADHNSSSSPDSIPAGNEDNGALPAKRNAPLRIKDKFAKHHVPYSLGVSVSIPFSERFALTSGLVYTRMRSDFSSHEQTLHYIGVPLGATYSIWKWRWVSLYAVGGVQADFNVKATLKEPYSIIDSHMSKDRVQFSAMLGPGLQFELNKNFSIYVEPTGRYYFNNGSDVLNYFKDKPWNINFNAGLRLTLK